jgi:hypothetical protein
MSLLQTEFEFTLPHGYVDPAGNLHRQGVMRLAAALDEVEPLQDARVRANEDYLPILLLSRVLLRLGDIAPVRPSVVEELFASDFAYLQELYLRVNEDESGLIETECPTCGKRFVIDLSSNGEAD